MRSWFRLVVVVPGFQCPRRCERRKPCHPHVGRAADFKYLEAGRFQGVISVLQLVVHLNSVVCRVR